MHSLLRPIVALRDVLIEFFLRLMFYVFEPIVPLDLFVADVMFFVLFFTEWLEGIGLLLSWQGVIVLNDLLLLFSTSLAFVCLALP